jgi:hypothetical protein
MFPKPGCAMCNLLVQLTDKTLQKMVYEWSNDDSTHQALRNRRGLCSMHSHLLVHHLGKALPITLLYRTAVDELVYLLQQMGEGAPSSRGRLGGLFGGGETGATLAARLAPTARCLVCETVDEVEVYYVDVLANRLTDARLNAAYLQSEGLCFPHFLKVLTACSDAQIIQGLIAVQKKVWDQVFDELDAYIEQTNGASSSDSWRRAAQQIPGDYRLFGVDQRSR